MVIVGLIIMAIGTFPTGNCFAYAVTNQSVSSGTLANGFSNPNTQLGKVQYSNLGWTLSRGRCLRV